MATRPAKIRVARTGSTVLVTIINYKPDDIITIYRAEDFQANFAPVARIDRQSYEDADLDLQKNYKYKASIAAEIGIGVLSFSNDVFSKNDFILSDADVDEDARSASKYTKGESL